MISMNVMPRGQKGFTIVELLIVIVVIAVLATISFVSYGMAQEKARQAKMASDIGSLIDAIQLARAKSGKTLYGITGSGYTGWYCSQKDDDTNLASLGDSDLCIQAYHSALEAIEDAGGMYLGDIRDPWGRPYAIDENEGDGGSCQKDSVSAYSRPFKKGFTAYPSTPQFNVPLSGLGGC